MKAIVVQQPGGPEALVVQEVPVPEPGPGQALVRIHSIGVNFIDIYHRTGLYPLPLPFTPGSEASGVVEAVGEGVTEVKPGDRVAYAMHRGAYAEYAVVPAWMLAPLPDELSFETGAAAMLQGLTAHYLTHSTFPIRPGHTVLVHAAAGGVGLLLVQMAKAKGATVIGTVSTRAKAELAKAAGADHVIIYTETDFVEAVNEITGGQKLDCVYDSVGKETFHKSLQCLKPRGYLVLFGQSSGPVPPIDLQILNTHGSLFVTRPSLGHYILDRRELLERTGDLFAWIAQGKLKLRIDSTFPLEQASEAHRRLESRASAGKILLSTGR